MTACKINLKPSKFFYCSGDIWTYLGVSGCSWLDLGTYLGVSGHIWVYLGVSGSIWGRIWTYLGVSGCIWLDLGTYLDVSGCTTLGDTGVNILEIRAAFRPLFFFHRPRRRSSNRLLDLLHIREDSLQHREVVS